MAAVFSLMLVTVSGCPPFFNGDDGAPDDGTDSAPPRRPRDDARGPGVSPAGTGLGALTGKWYFEYYDTCGPTKSRPDISGASRSAFARNLALVLRSATSYYEGEPWDDEGESDFCEAYFWYETYGQEIWFEEDA